MGDSEVDISNISSKIRGFNNIGWPAELDSFIWWSLSWTYFTKCLAVALHFYDCQISVLVQVCGSGIENLSLSLIMP